LRFRGDLANGAQGNKNRGSLDRPDVGGVKRNTIELGREKGKAPPSSTRGVDRSAK